MRLSRPLLNKILLLVAILLVVGVTVSGCGIRSEPKGWSGVLVTEDSVFVASMNSKMVGLDKTNGLPLWEPSLLSESGAKVAVYGTPVFEDGLIYVGGYKVDGNDGRVYAVSAETGNAQLVYPRGGSLTEPIVGGVVVSEGIVYFGGGDEIDGKKTYAVYAVDTVRGLEQWRSDVPEDKIWSTPVINGDVIYVSSFDRRLYALDINTGVEKWRFDGAEGAFVATPLLYQDTLYIGSFDRHVYAVNTADGSLKWRSEIEAEKWFWAKPVAYDGVIYAPAVDGRVYFLDAETGREVAGSIDLGSPISSDPTVIGDQVLIASEAGKVYSFDTNTFQRQLLFDVTTQDSNMQIFAPLAAGDGVVFVHARTSKNDALYAVEIETRIVVWSYGLVDE